jgi:hypothetical protein
MPQARGVATGCATDECYPAGVESTFDGRKEKLMARQDRNGNWIDAAGNVVPKKYVKPIDKKRDILVEKLVRLAEEESARILKFKTFANGLIDAYLTDAAQSVGLEKNPGGNYTLTGFSGHIQVERKNVAFIEFDEQLQFAKKKIDSCLQRWSEGANGNLKVVITDAFKVDKKGQVDRKRLLSLRKLEIRDAEWKEAMDLITEAITIVARREYLIFRVRNEKGEWETIHLDIARV